MFKFGKFVGLSLVCASALSAPLLADKPHSYDYKYNVDRFTVKSYLGFIRFIESSDNYNCKGGGAYQIKDGTRKVLIERNPFLGISESNWLKPENQDLLAAILLREGVQAVSLRKLPIDTFNLYLMHQLGSGLYTRVITAYGDKTKTLSLSDIKTLRNNAPCQMVSDDNSHCVKRYVINSASDYYNAWSDKIIKSGLNKKAASATSVVYAVNNRVKWRSASIKKKKFKPAPSKKVIKTKLFVESDLKGVTPEAKRFYRDFKAYMLKSLGIMVAVPKSGAYRTSQQQLRLYAKGRTKKYKNLRHGKPSRVTWTMSSYHTHGQALDIVWSPTYSTKLDKRIINHINLLIARGMRNFARDRGYNAKFLSLRKDPNHVQFGSIKKGRRTPTAAQLKSTKSWGWFKK